jgi:hypothetical protein
MQASPTERRQLRTTMNGRPSGRIVFIVLGLAVLACSFWLTLQVIDDGTQPPRSTLPPSAVEIHITEATYGLNCRGFAVPAGQINRVKVGNATQIALELCGKAKGSCSVLVDVNRMGDPAPGCRKDFSLQWRCGDVQKILEAYIPDEANGNSATATCP